MFESRSIGYGDKQFCFNLDHGLTSNCFDKTVRYLQGYIGMEDSVPVGLLRYDIFMDYIPFCTMLIIKDEYRGKGYGTELLSRWEIDMFGYNHKFVLVSTRVDETAQHFYRKRGYQDVGGLVLPDRLWSQPMELFMCKTVDPDLVVV